MLLSLFLIWLTLGLFTATGLIVYWHHKKIELKNAVCRAEITERALLDLIFWPLTWIGLLLKSPPQELITTFDKPVHIFDRNYLEKSMMAWIELITSLPQCGKYIAYRGTDLYAQSLPSVFVFEAISALPEALKQSAGLSQDNTDERSVIANLIKNRDDTILACTILPNALSSFSYITIALIESDIGHAYCEHCKTLYRASEITTYIEGADQAKGWSFYNLLCPQNHLLEREKHVHIF